MHTHSDTEARTTNTTTHTRARTNQPTPHTQEEVLSIITTTGHMQLDS